MAMHRFLEDLPVRGKDEQFSACKENHNALNDICLYSCLIKKYPSKEALVY